MVALVSQQLSSELSVLTKTELLSGTHKKLNRSDAESQELEYLKTSIAPNAYLQSIDKKMGKRLCNCLGMNECPVVEMTFSNQPLPSDSERTP